MCRLSTRGKEIDSPSRAWNKISKHFILRHAPTACMHACMHAETAFLVRMRITYYGCPAGSLLDLLTHFGRPVVRSSYLSKCRWLSLSPHHYYLLLFSPSFSDAARLVDVICTAASLSGKNWMICLFLCQEGKIVT